VRRSDLTQGHWFILLAAFMLALILFGLSSEPMSAILAGWRRILVHPSILISDYIEIGGMGAAMVNAGLVGLSGLLLARLNGVLLSGPTIAAVFTMAGFGLFGKTVLNIWPIIGGVAIFARVTRHPFKSYILVAMFGTALAPLVSQVAYGLGYGPLVGALFGVGVGFLLPPLAVYMLRLHQGYNLYNLGLTCGFLGLFVTSLLVGLGLPVELELFWSERFSAPLGRFLLAYVSSMLIIGLAVERRALTTRDSARRAWVRLRSLMRQPGTLPSDFVESHGAGLGLINMGLVGLIGWGYIRMVGGAFNGPTVGAVLTMAGFAAFGKHSVNIVPVMAGVLLGSAAMIWSPADPGPLLAALFATTLAPLSGSFGPLIGALAGLTHLTMVMRTASWHAGLNLYNNGFAGGLTATLLIGIIGWWSSWREEHAGKD
jgi:hypothetical protein